MVRKKEIHICSECLGEFDPKEIFIAAKPDREYSTVYCEKCIKKLKIEEFRPMRKTIVKKVSAKKTKKEDK